MNLAVTPAASVRAKRVRVWWCASVRANAGWMGVFEGAAFAGCEHMICVLRDSPPVEMGLPASKIVGSAGHAPSNRV